MPFSSIRTTILWNFLVILLIFYNSLQYILSGNKGGWGRGKVVTSDGSVGLGWVGWVGWGVWGGGALGNGMNPDGHIEEG